MTHLGFAGSLPREEPTPDALASILIARRVVDPRAVERGRRVAAESRQRLDAVLVQLGLASERDVADAAAELLGTDLVPAQRYPAALPEAAAALPHRFLRRSRAVPIAQEDETLLVALADPLDRFVPPAIEAATGLRVRVLVALPVELEAALNRLCPDRSEAAEAVAEDDAAATPGSDEDAERLRDLASAAPVIRLVNQLISRAVESRASDIHIEPLEDVVRVRYRYDGVLHEAEMPSGVPGAAVTSRLKIMAKLDIAERRLPQDGRIRTAVRGQEVDLRVSTLPSLHGETIVLRVLDRNTTVFDYERLGLSPDVKERVQAALALPNGIVLVTGPTGSGKTTTLYTGLLGLNSIERKIVTIEDPVEYQLQGITQVQVKPQIGLTFAQLLRSILRQDPDVIMVGEVRDLETAQIAVQASLTGHLVLSTLHTNSAAATIPRLRDMGLEDYLISAVLRGVLAQRLVRKLCVACRRPTPAAPEVVERLRLDRHAPGEPVTLWQAVGCPQCRGTGYRGRQAIAEFLQPNPDIERLIFDRADYATIERAAVAAGMTTMFEAGVEAAIAGDTTLEEVARSIHADA